MLLGHYAAAVAAKKAAPETSLGTLVFGAQFLDLIWPILLLSGLERVRIDPGNTAFTPLDFEHYPISHGLLAVLGWALLLGGGYWLTRRYRRGAVVVGILVVSHWLLDAVVHRPDLPVAPGGETRVGLGLWHSVPATLAVELLLWALGIWIYLRTTRATDRRGRWTFWGFVALLTFIHFGNVFGAPPAGPAQIGIISLGLWLFVPWGYWIDRHRATRPSRPGVDHGSPTPRNV